MDYPDNDDFFYDDDEHWDDDEFARDPESKRYHVDPNLPPELEEEWQAYFEEFDRQFENAELISVREYLGNPAFRPLDEIPPDDLETELIQVLDYLIERGISIDFLDEVEDAEAYRFIVEELLDEEVDDIRMDGLFHCFIYEEFHPNDVYDAKFWTEQFLFDWFTHDEEALLINVSQDELYDVDGAAIDQMALLAQMRAWNARQSVLMRFGFDVGDCAVTGDYATVEAHVNWESLRSDLDNLEKTAGLATLRLKRSPYGGWDVIQVRMPG